MELYSTNVFSYTNDYDFKMNPVGLNLSREILSHRPTCRWSDFYGIKIFSSTYFMIIYASLLQNEEEIFLACRSSPLHSNVSFKVIFMCILKEQEQNVNTQYDQPYRIF